MKKLLLISIFLLAFVLRIWNLQGFPVGFTPDEASFGYDAYSILKTGKDQWGTPFPLVLKSFGDYKSPLYSYLTIPSVAVFGLNKFAVRLPNAIFGTLAVLALYLLVKKLEIGKSASSSMWKLEILAALLLAISPWHISLSRGAFEANLTAFFLPLGIYLFLRNKYALSGIVLGLNLFTYHSAKFVTPIILLALIFYAKEKIKKVVPTLLFFGIFLVLTFYTFTQGAGARVNERSITNGALEDGAKIKIALIQKGMNPILARLLHNKYQVTAERFVKNYIQYFSPRFLVFDGPAETTYGMVRGLGVLTYAEIIGMVALAFLARKIKDKRLLLFLFFWLLIAPVPASLATGVGYAGNRVSTMIPVIQILAGWGIYLALQKYKYLKYLLVLAAIFGLGVFLNKYLIKSPIESAKGMLSGNLEIAQKIVLTSEKYDRLTVSKSLSEPQIYIAFASKYDPAKYQEASKNWNFEELGVSWVDQMPEYSLGKFTFK